MTKRYYKYRETHRTVKSRKQKYCTKCKKWKGESEFGIDRAKRDGLNIRCKDCYKAYTRELYRKYRKRKKVRDYLRFEERHCAESLSTHALAHSKDAMHCILYRPLAVARTMACLTTSQSVIESFGVLIGA